MNYLMMSPHFPKNLQNFAIRLKERGVNVLGIGTEPYDWLSPELRENLTEYYRVDDMENLDEVKRAVAFLIYKHGPIDRLESNNEYWLELDAALREQFNVPGVKPRDLEKTKYKSKMKKLFEKAGVPVVPGYLIKNESQLNKALKEAGLPAVAKPDRGVGTAATYRLETKEDVATFLSEWDQSIPYFVEPYVLDAELCTFDGLVDEKGQIVFSTSFVYSLPTLELIEGQCDYTNIVQKDVEAQLAAYGQAAVKAFGMKERFFHIEFFRRKKGDYVAIEYNNRLAGGYTIDLYNYAYGCDLYAIYADIVTGRLEETPSYDRHYGVGISRRDELAYEHNVDEIRAKYGDRVKMVDRLPDAFSAIMGNEFLVVLADTQEEVEEVSQYVHKKQGGQ